MQAVGILGRVDQLEHRVAVESVGQRQLHDVSGHLGIEFSSAMAARTSSAQAVAGRSMRTDRMPTSAQSRCLPAT